MSDIGNYHVSVMPDEVIDGLSVKKDGIYFDGTLGGGGHSKKILEKGGRLIAVDRDMDAIEYTQRVFEKNKAFADRYTIINDNFKNVSNILDRLNIDKVDGAILDLGISSHHIDEPKRGFSYMQDGPLDMRMDKKQELTASDIVNNYSEEEIADIIFNYGEERFSRRIAHKIILTRKESKITTTSQLSNIVSSCVPFNKKSGHSAKRTFQALRIAVNEELLGLRETVFELIERLKSGGRLLIITFHSLEDRIVKKAFNELATDCICDKSLPICVCEHKAKIRQKTLLALKPSKDEQEKNPRSRSAILRIAEKL